MFYLDYSDKRPIYEQVEERIQELILSGALDSDEKLPSVRNLAMDLSINPNTIQRAYAELERKGYIYSVKGRGNFVRGNEELKIQKRKKTSDELIAKIKECMLLGMTAEELEELLHKTFEEVK